MSRTWTWKTCGDDITATSAMQRRGSRSEAMASSSHPRARGDGVGQQLSARERNSAQYYVNSCQQSSSFLWHGPLLQCAVIYSHSASHPTNSAQHQHVSTIFQPKPSITAQCCNLLAIRAPSFPSFPSELLLSQRIPHAIYADPQKGQASIKPNPARVASFALNCEHVAPPLVDCG